MYGITYSDYLANSDAVQTVISEAVVSVLTTEVSWPEYLQIYFACIGFLITENEIALSNFSLQNEHIDFVIILFILLHNGLFCN